MAQISLILPIGAILIASRLVGRAFRLLGQPQVIGEIVAGILLGPSLLGWLAPGVSASLFPEDVISALGTFSEVGLVLFLFVIGLEQDPAILRGRGKTAVLVSHASIAVPFSLGVLLAIVLYPRLSDDRVTFTQFALFIGTAMSITALPVLARIVAERGLLGTHLGSLALVCAAVNDVTGWLIIASVLVVIRGGHGVPPWLAALGTVLFAVVMLTIGRRVMQRLVSRFRARGDLSADLLATILVIAFASAWVTEQLGAHPLFGAFLAGIAMPKDPTFVRALRGRLSDITVVLLLPIFFAVSGLKTRVGLVDEPEMWLYFAAILFVAIAGKLGGASIAGRTMGLPWSESIALGVLVNTRGLVELVLLNIGLDAGIISPALFTMMVLMAITTTVMTPPLLDLIQVVDRRRDNRRSQP